MSVYVHTEKIHNFRAAQKVLPGIIEEYKVKSILDVGTGIGTWLKVAEENGVSDFLGIDGSWVNREQLKIAGRNFKECDLREKFNLQREFDLIICLEVAEHLPEESADILVESMVQHGRLILFSAAIPGQGGQNHLNEQSPSFWSQKFEKHGYTFYDLVRPRIWKDVDIEWWYRQNMFLVSKEKLMTDSMNINDNMYIHPELFFSVINKNESLKNRLKETSSGALSPLSYLRLFAKSLYRKIGGNA